MVMDWMYQFTCSDGSVYQVPVSVIALNRAENYADEFGDDVERSLAEDTIPLFKGDMYEIQDWARNNMDWDDVKVHATKVSDAVELNMQNEWNNGDINVVKNE